MRRSSVVVAAGSTALAVGILVVGGNRLPLPWRAQASPPWQVVDRYCVVCHNQIDWAGGVSFETLARNDISRSAEVWEAAVRKVRTGFMPPIGEPRPEREVLDAMAGWLEHELDAAWESAPNPGAKPLTRLNRTEYANAVRDLLAYDPSAIADTLPLDVSVGGFDNIAEALSVSPTLLEAFAAAAMQIGRLAVGDRSMGHDETRYAAAPGAAQRRHIDGLPLGTRGGLVVEHNFPLDAEYELAVAASIPAAGWENPTGQMTWCNGPAVDVAFNGAPLEVENARRFRLRVPAGPQRITVALVDEERCAGVNELYLGEVAVGGAVQALTITGPFDATGVGDTPSRREIFVCHPSSAAEETPCAERILTRLATRAYRHPAGADELAELMQFYRLGREEGLGHEEGGNFEVGIQYALSRLLTDPRFLYRIEKEPADAAVGSPYRIGDLELASRLSFFLWSSIPDDELLAIAAADRLRDPSVLAAQVERMLADERASSLVENFASQWLLLRELDEVVPQDADFDADLKAAMRRETELLFGDLLRERRSVLDLLDADYTYLNERLAAHYGLDGVRGSHMRRVALPPESPRRGLLGHGSILTATSAPNRTSPVVRGQWIVENLLGAPVPSPPPGAEADLSAEASDAENLVGNTVRERLEMHRANSACAGCHGIMDPLGLALENFDLLGRWRDEEDGHPIDSTAEMVDGTKLEGPDDLRRALLARSDAFVTALTERLMTYALGRELEAHDKPVVRSVVRVARADGHTLHALVQAIVASDTFQKRVKAGAAPAI
jgi:hypothetical protein